MVSAAAKVWLCGARAGAEGLHGALAARGLAVARAAQVDALPERDWQALVYLAPLPPAGAGALEIVEHAAGVAAEFILAAKRAAKAIARTRDAGAIVAVCDIAGVPGRGGRIAEATASGALIGAVKCLAKELGRQSISANAVCFGFVPELGAPDTLTRPERKLFDMMQLGKPGSIDAVADNVAHLLANRHLMTGQVLHADHGLIM